MKKVPNTICSGKAIVLTADSPLGENSMNAPMKISPQTADFKYNGDNLRWKFPGNSVTVLRLAGENKPPADKTTK